MRLLNEEEIQEHKDQLKKFKKRIDRYQERYEEGEITRSRLATWKHKIKEEERTYRKESGIIEYFGNYFRGKK